MRHMPWIMGVLGFALLNTSGCRKKTEASAAREGREASAAVQKPDPSAGGILLRPRGEPSARRTPGMEEPRPLHSGEAMLISFPRPMVAASEFDKPNVISPVEFKPAVRTEFVWKSPTEGELTVRGPLPPATPYRIQLRADLRDRDGGRMEAPEWGREWVPAQFRVSVSAGSGDAAALPSQPYVTVNFSHPVAAAEVARTAVWRDDLGRKIESEVTVSGGMDEPSATAFGLKPVKPLEPWRTYELIVEDTRCALGGSRLPFVHVFPLGKTKPLTVEWVRARHQPVLGTFLELRFDQALVQPTTLPPNALKITPAAKITRTEISGPDLRVFGEFQPAVRYTVELAREAVQGRRGFGLGQKSTWHATFGAKRAAVILPRSIITTPAAHGVEVELVQVNTGRLHWKLARIPVEQLVAIRKRLDEYRRLETDNRDPRTNEMRMAPTTLLVPDLKLPVVSAGEFEASDGDREVERTLQFEAQQMIGGAYLLEISGAASDGRVAGNRALILVNREFLVWKAERRGMHARLFDLASGEPVAGAKIRVFGSEGRLLAEGVSDATGAFEPAVRRHGGSPTLVLVEREGGQSAHFAEFSGGMPWGGPGGERSTEWRHWLFTDRGIYRPGETMHVKGIMRMAMDDVLTLPPAEESVAWEIRRRSDSEPVLTGKSMLSDTGAWDAEIALPPTLPLGTYAVCVAGQRCDFKLDEFRAPAFAVELHAPEKSTDRTSRVRVISHYFHGAPNAQALVRWRAVWAPHMPYPATREPGAPYLSTWDYHSPGLELQRPTGYASRQARAADAEAEARSWTFDGTAVLDANGVANLENTAPFWPGSRLAAAEVTWEISVVAPDGQTVSAGGSQRVPLAKAQPAVGLQTKGPGEIELNVSALDLDGRVAAGTPLAVTLYHVAEKTVRETVSRHVVRYQNTSVCTPVLTREVTAPYRETIRVERTGRFVAVAELAHTTPSPRASEDTVVTGNEPAEFAQWDDRSVTLSPDKPRYDVGEMAHVALRAPFAGRAWVTIETERILQSFDVALTGNAAAVDIPITAAMHPNAYVNVYLFRPANGGEPAERMGACDLQVRRPDTELEIETKLAAPKVEPGEMVRGTIAVTSTSKPAANAEVTLFAVDEAILRYGHWQLPEPAGVFFPTRWHEVSTHSGLQEFRPRKDDEALFQKGFLIGDGSLGWRSRFVRSRFLPLAFWQANVRTDAAGTANFEFTAPDNLTDYRIVAVAQQGTEAFGSGAHHVQVARKLQAEPALPRFVRAGDQVDLRMVLRQDGWDELAVEAGCVVEGATLTNPAAMEKSLARALPQPVGFSAVVNQDATRLRVRFTVRAKETAKADDAVEIELPVRPARILRRETVAGVVPADGWSPASARPSGWREAEGQLDIIVSSSPWLPLLDGLPTLLEYPHGCVEQLSSRVLAYAMMADLLRALPDGDARAPEYRRRVEDGLTRLARAQLGDGNMPYWPGAKVVHPFATIQTAWAVAEAQRSGWTGWTVNSLMRQGIRAALLRIVRRQDGVRESATMRAFALRVAAALELEPKPRAEALELYQQRDALGDDGRAFLALALHEFQILPEEKRQLVAELEREPAERAFEPATFGSTARTAALRLCARATIGAAMCTDDERADRRRALTALMGSSQNFSTQENLWLLFAFRALVHSEGTAPAIGWELPVAPTARSADGRAVGWFAQSLAEFERQFADKGVRRVSEPAGSGDPALHPAQRNPTLQLGGSTGSFLLRATYRTAAPEARLDRGFRLERIVRNLTAPKRDGSAEAPFQLGDELAVTFRVLTDRAQAYVALEESLPAAFETVDPDYYRGARRGGGDFDMGGLSLSHWEKRDDRTLWYFDQMQAGTASYTAIVRVTSAGTFQWPGAAIAPMYDARFSGVSEGRTIVVR